MNFSGKYHSQPDPVCSSHTLIPQNHSWTDLVLKLIIYVKLSENTSLIQLQKLFTGLWDETTSDLCSYVLANLIYTFISIGNILIR